eukprot:COSAG02_NODE_66188_length_256_cov_0.656051_1_plen_51_part_01
MPENTQRIAIDFHTKEWHNLPRARLPGRRVVAASHTELSVAVRSGRVAVRR